jgi:hypothetical protein
MMKQVADAEAWDTLHDMMLIYLAFMHGSQAVRASFNTEAVLSKMRSWWPEQEIPRLRNILSQVMLTYMSVWGVKMLETAVLSLRQALPVEQRADILVDITRMVGKDVEDHLCARCPGAISP